MRADARGYPILGFPAWLSHCNTIQYTSDYCKVTAERDNEKIEINQYLMKICTRVCCLLFTHGVQCTCVFAVYLNDT